MAWSANHRNDEVINLAKLLAKDTKYKEHRFRNGKNLKPFIYMADGEMIECNALKLRIYLSETRLGLSARLYCNLDGQVVIDFG